MKKYVEQPIEIKTVGDLIKALKNYPEDMQIRIWDELAQEFRNLEPINDELLESIYEDSDEIILGLG